MKLKVTTIASSSGGNCYLIEDEKNGILVDLGISCKRVTDFLKFRDMGLEYVKGLFLTHGHIDHIKGLKTFHKKASHVPVFLTNGTLREIKNKFGEILTIEPDIVSCGEEIELYDFFISAFPLSHDALEAVGYTVSLNSYENCSLSIVTDTGFISEEIYCNIKDSDIFILEANHEVNLLLYGGYPYPLKQRILGSYGHLSNEQAADLIIRILEERKSKAWKPIPKFILSHLSRENNTPNQAYITVKNTLEEEGYYVGKDLELYVAPKDEPLEVVI